MPIPWIVGGLVLLGGILIGGIARQFEINKLKKQIKILQQEIVRLQAIIQEQDRQINELKIRYAALKGYHFIEKLKRRCDIKGHLYHQYGLMEYLDMMLSMTRKIKVTDEQALFFHAYQKVLHSIQIEKEEFLSIKRYLDTKYGREINQMIPPRLDAILAMIGEAHV